MKGKTLLEEIAQLDDVAPDLDPEDFNDPNASSWAQAGVYDEEEGTEKPSQKKGKRRRQSVPLRDDPAYSGSVASRKSMGFDRLKESDDDDGGSNDDLDDDSDDGSGEDVSGEGSENYEDSDDNDGLDSNDDDNDDDNDSDDDDDDNDEGDDAKSNMLFSKPISSLAVTDTENGMSKLQSEFQLLEQAEAKAAARMASSSRDDTKKGKHAHHQLAMYDACLETRIRLQQLLSEVNKLPQKPEVMGQLAPSEKPSMRGVLDKLLDLQSAMLDKNQVFPPPKRLKQSSPEDYESTLASAHEESQQFTLETIEKWSIKTRLSSGKGFKALGQSIADQITQATADKNRLRKRTQLKRSEYKVIAKEDVSDDAKDETTDDSESDVDSDTGYANRMERESKRKRGKSIKENMDYDTNIFDDTDFYHNLIRDLIERKTLTGSTGDPIEMGQQWVQLNKLRSKLKRKATGKASKGRKVRYHIHPKLVNFMTPITTEYPATDEAKDQLFTSLFGHSSK